MAKTNRLKGTLFGLATGDALGTTLEFTLPGTFEPITDMVGGGPFNLEPGQWTDDTSMALCLAESLIECQGFDLHDQARRYLRWYREGHLSSTGRCFDIGATVSGALQRFEETGQISGATGKFAAGNGSLMRLAPLPMAYSHDLEKAMELAALQSTVTHDNIEAMDACRYYAALIVGALNGATKEALLPRFDLYQPAGLTWNLSPNVARVASGSYMLPGPPRGTGYVVEAMEAALWAFYHSDNFRAGALLAANLGQDADTTAAIYGQLAGAYYGLEAIPRQWLARLAHRDVIDDYAGKLKQVADG